jgi:hypothetical protein
MEVVLLVGGRPYTLPEQSALELRDRIREHAPDDLALGYLADAIAEDLENGESPGPFDLGHEQIEGLVDVLFGVILDGPLQRLQQACSRFFGPESGRARY